MIASDQGHPCLVSSLGTSTLHQRELEDLGFIGFYSTLLNRAPPPLPDPQGWERKGREGKGSQVFGPKKEKQADVLGQQSSS